MDINKDGDTEVIASPITAIKNGYYYFPDWKTQIYTWNKEAKTLDLKQTIDNILPAVRWFYFEENAQSSFGATAKILFTKDGNKIRMVGNDTSKAITKVDITI